MDLNDSGDMHSLGSIMSCRWSGLIRKKDGCCPGQAGKAAEEWIENMSHYECHKASKEKREKQLRKEYDKQKEEG